MHRFFVSSDSILDRTITFGDAQSRQIRDVLRMRQDDQVVVLDNKGNEYLVALRQVARNLVQGEILERRVAHGEPRTTIVLYQALLKADKFEWVLQKGTEVGIREFVPLVTARTIADTVGKQKFARWQQIIREAAEQAVRGKLPLLHAHQPFKQALEAAAQRDGSAILPWEEEHERDLNVALNEVKAETVHLFIGPEGGFTVDEVEAARARGAQSITLGPRILRAETAGLVAASAILFARGDLSRA